VLEQAVRWVIILIVIVFDPLALTLLLAATKSFEWEHSIDLFNSKKKKEEDEAKELVDQARKPANDTKHEPDDGPLTSEQIDQINDAVMAARKDQHTHIPVEDYYQAMVDDTADNVPLAADPIIQTVRTTSDPSSPGWMFTSPTSAKWAFPNTPEEIKSDNIPVLKNEEAWASQAIDEADHNAWNDIDPAEKQARRAWKAANPNDTLSHQRALHKVGHISELPWHHPDYYPELRLQADNMPTGPVGEVKGFGSQFPTLATKGDMFLRVDRLPSALYKYNGANWIEVDKDLSDNYAYDDAYIDHLIVKIDSGEYDPELLSETEQEQVTQRLQTDKNT
jgi:vacuolar-type H+-ATPase subunit H